jgi:hypothetical protein
VLVSLLEISIIWDYVKTPHRQIMTQNLLLNLKIVLGARQSCNALTRVDYKMFGVSKQNPPDKN